MGQKQRGQVHGSSQIRWKSSPLVATRAGRSVARTRVGAYRAT
jgi:hypothetical protein